jgi:uncharacterized protein
MSDAIVRRWRRLDEPGLEVLHLLAADGGIHVTSELVHAGADPFGLRYAWSLDRDWRTRSLRLSLRHDGGDRACQIERTGPAAWSVDGQPRADLAGCAELDVSATPFCNPLAVRHLGERTGELTVAFVDLPALSIVPSRQRYEALGPGQWRYIDLGAAKGFTAVLTFDPQGLVRDYEGLFETIG